MFKKAKWIWTEDNKTVNQWVRFTKAFTLDKPADAVLRIGAETKYYLFVNGRLTVFDGGLFRESEKGKGYFDEVPLKDLKSGRNEIVIDVWYYGNGGRNNVRLESAGLIFECEELGFYSGRETMCGVLQAYYRPEGEQPAYLYGGFNIGYDAGGETVSSAPAAEYGGYGSAPFNELIKRPVPLFCFGGNTPVKPLKRGGKYIVKLPYAMQCSPYLKVKAKKGVKIDIRSDRYYVNGGPGDNTNRYRGHRYEYICRDGLQEYCAYNWLFGEELIFTAGGDIEIVELGYRESGFDTGIRLRKTKDALLNRLLEKCARTLKVCMRENFMDCPDRERGQWIGDVSVQAPQVFLCLDDNAKLLLRKAVLDFFNLRKGDVLVGNVPGEHCSELPAQSLNAIGELGMLAHYYKNTGDKEILNLAYKPSVAYLKLWDMNGDGLVSGRNGDWRWFDHNFNVDEKTLENCWYYSALKYAAFMAGELGVAADNDFLNSRIKSIEANFDKVLWKNRCYAGGGAVDDRANATAVLTGLASPGKYPQIRDVLVTVFNSTTYMEGYVLEALCVMGYKEDAYKRMMSRYYPLIINENSTLWEDFYVLGTKNHAWSGSPLTIVCKYFPELFI